MLTRVVIHKYIGAFLSFDKTVLFAVLMLTLLAGMTEGIGLLLALPLLTLLGVGETAESSFSQMLVSIFDYMQLPLELGLLLTGFMGLISLRVGVVYLRNTLSAKLYLCFGKTLFQRFWQAVSEASWHDLGRAKRSEYIHTLTIEIQRLSHGGAELIQLFSSCILMTIYLVIAYQLSWQLTLGTSIFGGLVFLLTKKRKRQSLISAEKALGLHQGMSKLMTNLLSGLRYAKANGIEDRLSTEFMQQTDLLLEARLFQQKNVAFSDAIFHWLGALGLMAFLWVGLEVLTLEPATLILMVLIMARLFPVWARIERSIHFILQVIPAYNIFIELEQQMLSSKTLSENSNESAGKHKRKNISLSKGIRLRNVTMRYGEAPSRKILSNQSLEIPANQITVLSGPSGVGKTSFADVVAGLLPIETGNVYVDDQPLTDIDRQAWCQAIAYMPQESFLLDGTVQDNLLWCNEGASSLEMKAVLEKTGCMKFLSQKGHDQELSYQVGENGNNLSGGEKQRMSLACMLIRKPKLLILDEVTNALDPVSRNHFLRCLQEVKKDTTILMISHDQEVHAVADYLVDFSTDAAQLETSYDTDGLSEVKIS